MKFRAKIWVYSGMGGWHFATLPASLAKKIRGGLQPRRGFGSVRVLARIGKTEWKTSIFPDTKSKSYLLPVKANVRKAERIIGGKTVQIELILE